jgi:leucyl aminopeptidase
MDVTLRKATLATRAADVLAVGVGEGAKLTGAALALDRATRGAVASVLKSGDFKGLHAETALLYPKGVKAKRVLLVGLGPRAGDGQALMRAAAQAARRARDLGAKTLALALDDGAPLDAAGAQAIGEGLVLGHYRHTAYKRDARAPLVRAEVLVPAAPAKGVAAAMERGIVRGEAVCLARDLANTPGQDLVPEQLAARAREVAKTARAKISVLDVPAMERVGMGCVLAVGRGSAHPPRFIVLERGADAPGRRGAKKAPAVVVIGKGVTFDTGGYSLKPREGMSKMKYDMSGAAAVLGLFAASPTMTLPFRLVGLIPSAENMVGDAALKPGDVVRALDGTTIEVTNTDAEGRLLLADALGYAKRFEPEVVVDLATLTGAISIALGRAAAGLFTRDDALAAELGAAGEETGERLWRMPLWDDYLVEMKGETADLVNSSEKREGASCTAAAFLEHFARGLRWAHLDIASTAWTFSDRPESSRGANAFGVRLLTRWVEQRAAKG